MNVRSRFVEWCLETTMMAGDSEEEEFDERGERFESCSPSADVSEYGSLSDHSSDGDLYGYGEAVSSLNYSPIVGSDIALNSSFRLPSLPVYGGRDVLIPPREPEKELSEVELMKEWFAKLLLGEDMSGRGEGTCTALAISNAITNLSATVFGELWRLEPLAQEKKLMWKREMDWLLCVSDSIVEFISSEQEFPGGEGTFEVMVTRPRFDLYINLPALKKLDAMLLSVLDGFSGSEFDYVDRGVIISGSDDCETHFPSSPSVNKSSTKVEEKWWLPFPRVPPNGLSEGVTNKLQQSKEWTNQILKAAMAINSSVVTEMEIPDFYLDSLPKSGRVCLGETIYHFIAAEQFSPECLLDYLDLSSEYATLEITDRMEAAVHIWRQKFLNRHRKNRTKAGRSSWGGKVKGLIGYMEKKKLLAQRAETILQNLRIRFPGLPQTALDKAKIQYNKDVGKSILESYSRVMESLAFNIVARIDDLLYIDDATKTRAQQQSPSP